MKRLITVLVLLTVAAAFCFAQTTPPPAPEKKAEPVMEKKVEPVAAEKKAEATPVPATKMVGEIAVKNIPAMTVVAVVEKAADFAPKDGYKAGMDGASQAYEAMMKDAVAKLTAWMTAGGKPTGPMFGIYNEDPTTTAAKDLTAKIGFPAGADAKGNDVVKTESMPAQDCAVVQFSGPYEGTGEIYGALMKWIPEHKYAYAGSPMEIYIKGPHETQKADEYLTEIHFPVMKAEMKPMEMKAGEKPADVKAPEKPAEPKTGGK
jgi:effector-binding domain-containing protein